MITQLTPDALVLETERLILRPFDRSDEDLAIALWCDPEVMRYVGDPDPVQELRDFMPTVIRRGAGGRIGTWSVARRDTGHRIGECFLLPTPIEHDDTDWSQIVPDAYPDDVIEVGYLLVRDAWGQGFATEACRRLLRFAFEQTAIDCVHATIDPDNAASLNVLTKCGLQFIGLHRAYGADDAPWYRIARHEWQARPAP
ncbi:MAG: GNAT family N-acetyltransferase [Pseudomonadota bacterium]